MRVRVHRSGENAAVAWRDIVNVDGTSPKIYFELPSYPLLIFYDTIPALLLPMTFFL